MVHFVDDRTSYLTWFVALCIKQMLSVLAYVLMENTSTFVFRLLLNWCLSVKRKTGFLLLYEKTKYGTSWKGNKFSLLSKNGGKRCAGVPVYLKISLSDSFVSFWVLETTRC